MKKLITFLIICSITLIFLTGCNDIEDDNKSLISKIEEELNYLDSEIIEMLNELNSISLTNYDISIKEVTSQEEQSGATSEKTSSQESSRSDDESAEETSTQKESNIMTYEMIPNNILTKKSEINWGELKTRIENLYSTWSVIVLDLYEANINSQDILDFSYNIDNCITAIKNEDKITSLENLAIMYSYIPKYFSNFSNDSQLTKIKTIKSSVMNAYSLVDIEDWNKINEELLKAEDVLVSIINDINNTKGNQFSINKAYILLKELQTSVTTMDKDIFYIKYKSLIAQINIL
ncbi:MAG: hypothetical protein Q4F88_07080 [Eubacteriales bacterium]|nr:hypothetical protein [Eubacteriales bacterium]